MSTSISGASTAAASLLDSRMTTLLYVTAPRLDHKLFNYIILHLRDWEFGSPEYLKLVTTKNAYNLEPSPEDSSVLEPSKTPVPVDIENAWGGAALEDIEAFTNDVGRAQPEDTRPVDTSFFMLIDEEGIEHENCVFAERHIDWNTEPPQDLESFRKVRVPWSDVPSIWANLSAGDVSFEEMADERENDGSTTREWYTYAGLGEDTIGADGIKARDDEINRFRAEGLV